MCVSQFIFKTLKKAAPKKAENYIYRKRLFSEPKNVSQTSFL